MKGYGRTLRDVLLYKIDKNSYARIYRKGRLVAIVYTYDGLSNVYELSYKLFNSRVLKIELIKDDCFKEKTYKIDLV